MSLRLAKSLWDRVIIGLKYCLGNCDQESAVHSSSLYVHMVDKNPKPVSDALQAACHSLPKQL